MFAKLNQFYFDKLQAGYDFLWDRFGIYLYVVFLIGNLPLVVIDASQDAPLWRVALGIVATIYCALDMLSAQAKHEYTSWNTQVESYRRWFVYLIWFATASQLFPPYRGTEILVIVILPITGGCFLVFLRKRKPSPKKEPQRALATAGAS